VLFVWTRYNLYRVNTKSTPPPAWDCCWYVSSAYTFLHRISFTWLLNNKIYPEHFVHTERLSMSIIELILSGSVFWSTYITSVSDWDEMSASEIAAGGSSRFLQRCAECRRSSDENSVCLSVRSSISLCVCQTRDLWQNGKRSVQIFKPYERLFSFLRRRMVDGGDPFYLKCRVKLTALERNRRFSI